MLFGRRPGLPAISGMQGACCGMTDGARRTKIRGDRPPHPAVGASKFVMRRTSPTPILSVASKMEVPREPYLAILGQDSNRAGVPGENHKVRLPGYSQCGRAGQNRWVNCPETRIETDSRFPTLFRSLLGAWTPVAADLRLWRAAHAQKVPEMPMIAGDPGCRKNDPGAIPVSYL